MNWWVKLLETVPSKRFQAFRLRRWQQKFGAQSLEDLFEDVYRLGSWGSAPGEVLYSGWGSRGRIREDYLKLLQPELLRRGVRTLVDLGCGDFQVGSGLAECVEHYTGIDISRTVVETNQRLHGAPGRVFQQGNLTRGPLPGGDAGVVRQVLQHLSNEEIRQVFEQARGKFAYFYVSEHIHLNSDEKPNEPMAHGPWIRASEGSGVRPDLPPFSFPVEWLGDIEMGPGEVLRTWVLRREVWR